MIKHQKNSERTQRNNTVGSYKKAINAINKGHDKEVTTILDYAAGHGLGTEIMLELSFEVKCQLITPHPTKCLTVLML